MFEEEIAAVENTKDRFELKKIINSVLKDSSQFISREGKLGLALFLSKARPKLRVFYREAIINAKSKKELKEITDELKDDKIIKGKGHLLGSAMLKRLKLRGKI